MKHFFNLSFSLLMVMFLLNCNDRNDENLVQNVEPVKIDSVKIAQDSMTVFTIQAIKTFSNFKNNCEGFYGYDYKYTGEFTRTVASYKFKTAASCGEPQARVSQINFQPQRPGNYVFRFWNGKNAAGENIWIEKTIKVK